MQKLLHFNFELRKLYNLQLQNIGVYDKKHKNFYHLTAVSLQQVDYSTSYLGLCQDFWDNPRMQQCSMSVQ